MKLVTFNMSDMVAIHRVSRHIYVLGSAKLQWPTCHIVVCHVFSII